MLPKLYRTIAQARRHCARPGAEVCPVTQPMRPVIHTRPVWLLCNSCNRGIGYFGDDLEVMAAAARHVPSYRQLDLPATES
jgi:hypothetical protein